VRQAKRDESLNKPVQRIDSAVCRSVSLKYADEIQNLRLCVSNFILIEDQI